MVVWKRDCWIKLKDSFLTSDIIDYLMSKPNGANYVVLFEMLCLKAVNSDGRISRNDINEISEDCKWFSFATIRVALELYKSFGLLSEAEDGMFIIASKENLIGIVAESGNGVNA